MIDELNTLNTTDASEDDNSEEIVKRKGINELIDSKNNNLVDS